jgi:hypothetical protein
MKQLFLVQSLPYENWETIAHFDNFADAEALRDRFWAEAEANPLLVSNYRVHAVLDTPEHRARFKL